MCFPNLCFSPVLILAAFYLAQFFSVSVIRESTNKLDYELNGLWPFVPQRDEIVKFIYCLLFGSAARGRYGRSIRDTEKAEIFVRQNFLI